MIRRAVLLLLLLAAALLVVADRLTESAAAHAIAVRARQVGLLAADPTVTIQGFPFLTQALSGDYREIDVTTHGIHRGGLRIDTVTGRFRGVHVGLGAALSGRVSSVPIDAASGEIDVTYADLDAYLASRHLTVSPDGTALRVAGTATVGGKVIEVGGPVTAAVTGGILTLTPAPALLTGIGLPASLAGPVSTALTVSVAVTNLPFGLRLQSLTVGPTALRITAAATGLVVPVPADAAQH